MRDYPTAFMPPERVQPVPRRIRAFLADQTVVDTTHALYVWEVPYFPSLYFPPGEVRSDLLQPEDRLEDGPFGPVEVHSLQIGDEIRPGAARLLRSSEIPELNGAVKLEWSAMDAWYEEDERVFVHPRNPYTRVDTVRSTRNVRVEMHGLVLAETSSPIMLFETGLPTRYYINRMDVDFSRLRSSPTVTQCPYKGTTSAYWSLQRDDRLQPDVAWSYDFPTREALPIAGLVAFYNEKVDLIIDGRRMERPTRPR